MSKRTYGHVLEVPSRPLVRPAAADAFIRKCIQQLLTKAFAKLTSTSQKLIEYYVSDGHSNDSARRSEMLT